MADKMIYNSEFPNGKKVSLTPEEISDQEARTLSAIEENKIKDAQKYATIRAAKYPSTGDQMDMIYKDNKNGTTTHADAIEAVKTKWPKDNSGPV